MSGPKSNERDITERENIWNTEIGKNEDVCLEISDWKRKNMLKKKSVRNIGSGERSVSQKLEGILGRKKSCSRDD